MGCCLSEPVKIVCDHTGQTQSHEDDSNSQSALFGMYVNVFHQVVHKCPDCTELEPTQYICHEINQHIETIIYLLNQLKKLEMYKKQIHQLDTTSDVYIRLNHDYDYALSRVNQCSRIEQLFKDVAFLNNIQPNQRQILGCRQINVNQMLIDLNQLINQLQEITNNQSSNEIK